MEDINKLLNEARAAAAREAAIVREREQKEALEAWEQRPPEADVLPELPSGVGVLEVERQQGRWRCFLSGQRIRSGQELDAYINASIGWVRGRLHWARSPHTPPSIRIDVTHPEARDLDGRILALGEVELLLPEDTLCRWPLPPTAA